MNKYLKEILIEMCKRVNAKYEDIDFKKEQWFLEYEWTNEEETSFINWLVDYMKQNKEARDTLMMFPRNNKRDLERFANSFIFNYGWKYK